MVSASEALAYHAEGRPGKLAIRATKPMQTQRDLALAYSPGVAEPCTVIAERPDAVFDYTVRGNLVAVVSNGTAVLGLGDIGPLAAKPVMEGKAVLFKRFADIDVFDLEVAESDPDRFIEVVAALEPTFGGINLEDIKAPECFYIEEKLRARMQIPVFHDDQHGTAIIAAAAFVNALEISGKAIETVRCVFSGAGAAAIACAELFVSLGVPRAHILMCDSRGVIRPDRGDSLNDYKGRFAVETDRRTLADALVDADVFVGVSVKGLVTPDMLRTMGPAPIVMAMANPDPEITYPEAKAARPDCIMATGRSDYPNQVNNVLGFPFIFRGALDVRATAINEAMKIAAVHAVAALAKEDVPDDVRRAYAGQTLKFGPDYIIPTPFDTRALLRVAPAVARAAMASGVARRPITDFEAYQRRLESLLGREREVMRQVIRKASAAPATLVFAEGTHPKVLRAAQICLEERICQPIVLGEQAAVAAVAAEHDIDLTGLTLIDHTDHPRREAFVQGLWARRARSGMTQAEADRRLRNRSDFAAMMVASGQADGMLTGMTRSYPDSLRPLLQIIGAATEVRRVAGAHLVILPDSVKIFADTTVNVDPDAETLVEIALAAAKLARELDLVPQVAMLSFSNFGSSDAPAARKVRDATAMLHARAPDLMVDGEVQVGAAIDPAHRERLFPFSALKGEANVLVFPDLNAANIGYKLLAHLGDAELVGPLLMGMDKPVNIIERDASVRQVVNMAAMTVVQAQDAARRA